MEKRHDDLLTTRIEEVTAKGWSFIAWWEAYLWTGQKKLGKNFWRDLKRRFDERNKANTELYIYQNGEGVLLIHGTELTPISSKIGSDDEE